MKLANADAANRYALMEQLAKLQCGEAKRLKRKMQSQSLKPKSFTFEILAFRFEL